MDRRFVSWVALATLSGVALGCMNWKRQGTDTDAGSADVKATLCGFDGVESAIAAAKGKVVLIDCWATWCGPCVASFPKLVEKHRKYGPRGLAVISLSLDEVSDADAVTIFLRKRNATFTNLHLKLDGQARAGLQQKLGYRGAIPHAVVFDKRGEQVWAGHPMSQELEGVIEAELAR